MSKVLCNKMSLMFLYITFQIPYDFKNPFVTKVFSKLQVIGQNLKCYVLYGFISCINSLSRIRTLYDLIEINWIIFYHSNVIPVISERDYIIIWHCTSLSLVDLINDIYSWDNWTCFSWGRFQYCLLILHWNDVRSKRPSLNIANNNC